MSVVALLLEPATPVGAVVPTADLSVGVASEPDRGVVGEPITYMITVRNQGPDRATNVFLYHSGPPVVEAQYSSVTTDTGNCDTVRQEPGTQLPLVLRCGLGDMASGAVAVVKLRLVPTSSGFVTTTSSVTSQPVPRQPPPPVDPEPSNNQTATATPVGEGVQSVADLSLEMRESSNPAPAGRPLDYVLTVTNNGPDAAGDVQLVDILPVERQARRDQLGGCKPATDDGQVVSCAMGNLQAGATASITITITPMQAGYITNAARASTPTGIDPHPANNQALKVTAVDGGPAVDADLSVTVADNEDPVALRSIITYMVTVKNQGPNPVDEVSLLNTLMDVHHTVPQAGGVEVVAAAPSQGRCDLNPLNSGGQAAQSVPCHLGRIAAGASATVEVKVRHYRPGVLVNVVSVSGATNDPEPSNDQAVETTAVVAEIADVSVTMVSLPAGTVTTGSSVLYTIRVTNNGPHLARNLSVVDKLPAGVAYRASSVAYPPSWPKQGACSNAGPEAPGVLDCPIQDLPTGSTAIVRIRVTATEAGTLSNHASVASSAALVENCGGGANCGDFRFVYPATDPAPNNNEARATTTARPGVGGPLADLMLVKEASTAAATVGDTFTYSLTVSNDGPDPTEGVVRDQLPAELTYRSSVVRAPKGGSCELPDESRNVDCRLGSLEAGSWAIIDIEVVATRKAKVINTASVDSALPDASLANNKGQAVVNTACGDRPPAAPGQVIFEEGWSLIGLPDGASVAPDSPLFGWYDQGAGGAYGIYAPTDVLTPGLGYWAFFSCPQAVRLPPGSASASFSLSAHHAAVVGNPSGTSSAVVSGHDRSARWDAKTGAYHLSEAEPQTLRPGEAMWVLSHAGTTIQVLAGP